MSGCGIVEDRHKLHKVYYSKKSVDEEVPTESLMNAAEFVSRLIVQRCQDFRWHPCWLYIFGSSIQQVGAAEQRYEPLAPGEKGGGQSTVSC
jgi:hypothetical protein